MKTLILILNKIGPVRRFVNRKTKLIEDTDPERITVKNISDFYGLSRFLAKFLLELCVLTGRFSRIKEPGAQTVYRIK